MKNNVTKRSASKPTNTVSFYFAKFINPRPFIHFTYLNATFIIWPACICNAYCK